MLESFSGWLTETPLHNFLSDTTHLATWLIVPVSQTIHILAVATVMISVAMLNLRLLGVAGKRESFAQLTGQLMPWIWTAMLVLLFTGIVQTIAEPERELLSVTFKVKLVMIAAVVAITLLYSNAVKKDATYWERPNHRAIANALAVFSLTLWIGIAAAGRLIAYMI